MNISDGLVIRGILGLPNGYSYVTIEYNPDTGGTEPL